MFFEACGPLTFSCEAQSSLKEAYVYVVFATGSWVTRRSKLSMFLHRFDYQANDGYFNTASCVTQ